MKNPTHMLIHDFLYLLKIRIDMLCIREVYARHPLPHSLRSLSDTLDELQVENAVYRLEFEQLFEIEGAFIVVAGKNEHPFYIVENLDRETSTVTLRTATGKQVTLSFDQFRTAWDGTVLMAEKGEHTREEAWLLYWIKQALAFLDRTTLWWIAGLAVCLSIWGVLQSPSVADLRYLIKAIGVAVSLLIIVKASFNSRLAQRFCRQGKHTDCNEVFRSAGAKLFSWVSLGELSLTYFAVSLLFGIFMHGSSAGLFLLLDSLALLFVVYSLIWQADKWIWCPLCLAIDGVLVADFAVEVFLREEVFQVQWTALSGFSLLFALGLLAVRRIVGMAEENRTSAHLKYKREQLLASPELFWQLLCKQPEEAADSNMIHTVCNYVEAEHTITVVMNPSCPKCVEAHRALASLEGYRINLVFIVNEGDERSREAALVMISAGVQYEWEITDRIIRDWYARGELPAVFQIHRSAAENLEEQRKYCQRIRIEGTPTMLVDNRRLPQIYDIEDLKVLL